MLKLLADEDFDNRIVRGLQRRQPGLDILRIQDTFLAGGHDREILAWAYQEQRLLLTHDVNTMTRYAFERLQAGQHLAGIIEVPQALSIRIAIEDILLICATGELEEFLDQVLYLPL